MRWLGAPTVIAVAVCARPTSSTLSLCLSALAAAGARPTVIAVRPSRGLAQARNEALATTPADVLAFVDDDVAVAPGWLEALGAAWSGAPDHRACIGGPIGVRFLAQRPAWLSDGLLGVSGVGNAGTTFHGGNVSFRADALRGVGGFWPARGRPELHDWFSEEHHAQRELSAAGWSAALEPMASAERLIDTAKLGRRAILARRARYGARSALIGERRPWHEATCAMIRSAAGVGVAVVRRDEAGAFERAGRAAENAGVLLAPPLAHRDLQPVATQTPFRHSVPAPQPLFAPRRRRSRSSVPVVLVYHRVDNAKGSGVTTARFAAQLDVLLHRHTPTSLHAIVSGEAPANAVAITFDDVYALTMRNALPSLAAAGVPATLFISTGHLGHPHGFWWDEVARLLHRDTPRPLRLTVEGQTRAWADGRTAGRHLIAWLQPQAPEAIEQALRELRNWAERVPQLPDAERPPTLAELRAIAASPLVEIGSHTRTHPNLRWSEPARRVQELVGSRQDLSHWLDIDPPQGLAYPFGVPGADVDAATTAAARDAGFGYAVLNSPGAVTADTDRYALPRLAAEHTDADAFAALLQRAARPR